MVIGIFSDGFKIWVGVNIIWFVLITSSYLYFGQKYEYTPGEVWPRIKLDILVAIGCLFVGCGGYYYIETDQYLNLARGRDVDTNSWS